MSARKVSAVMPVHNGATYLSAAIDSVICQTHEDFELIIVDDGSSDATADIVAGYSDSRVRCIRLEKSGLVAALNAGLQHAAGAYIARMDADDICYPDRFSVQVAELEGRQELGLVCSDIVRIDVDGNDIGAESFRGLDSDVLRDGLLYKKAIKPVVHPTVMMRREVYERVGGYRRYHCAEDHDYWLRCVDRYGFSRIARPLLRYRVNDQGVSRTKSAEQMASAMMSAINYEVHLFTKTDLYSEHVDLWTATLACLRVEEIPELAMAASSFQEIKGAVRAKQPWSVAKASVRGIARSGMNWLPGEQLRRKREAVTRLVRTVVGSL
ncbi:MAG: glycosyltransferase [Lysobacteraceae bacterium]|nr:MAG: glycosyltransferase [Xanthomonadaceae bacterium]